MQDPTRLEEQPAPPCVPARQVSTPPTATSCLTPIPWARTRRDQRRHQAVLVMAHGLWLMTHVTRGLLRVPLVVLAVEHLSEVALRVDVPWHAPPLEASLALRPGCTRAALWAVLLRSSPCRGITVSRCITVPSPRTITPAWPQDSSRNQWRGRRNKRLEKAGADPDNKLPHHGTDHSSRSPRHGDPVDIDAERIPQAVRRLKEQPPYSRQAD